MQDRHLTPLIQCSERCGGGRRTRPVACVLTGEKERVPHKFCRKQNKPTTSQHCNTKPCTFIWKTGEWSKVIDHYNLQSTVISTNDLLSVLLGAV